MVYFSSQNVTSQEWPRMLMHTGLRSLAESFTRPLAPRGCRMFFGIMLLFRFTFTEGMYYDSSGEEGSALDNRV